MDGSDDDQESTKTKKEKVEREGGESKMTRVPTATRNQLQQKMTVSTN